MGFVGVYRAIYDYVPKGEQELAITEGDLLYVLQKSTENDWWKAKKKAPGEDDEEPVGLIPSNYIEEAVPSNHAKALYEYTRQTDEELSFAEDTPLIVYDTSDPDWSLVGFNGEYGFAPANYIELSNEQGPKSAPKSSKAHNDEAEARYGAQTSSSRSSPERTPAATLAGIMGSNSSSSHPETSSTSARRPTFTPDASDDEGASASPVLLSRPRATSSAPSSPGASPRGARLSSPPHNRAIYHGGDDEEAVRSPAGFHMYHVSEMVSALGKKKKLPTTLGINVANGTIMLAPEKARDGPQQEWTAEKLQHYSIEGKHVFLDLVRPSRSLDLHGGAKDTAQEIVAALGEIAGAARAEGLREVIAAGAGMGKALKKGQILYDFMAQGDDEVTVGVGDDVIIVDDTKSDEWWMVRRLKNGKEGVVPSSYVEITGITTLDGPTSMGGVNAVRSTTEQNRLEEERLTRETAARSKNHESSDRTHGVQPPERGSSLTAKPNDRRRPSTRGKRESKDDKANAPKSKPEAARMRTWTDRSNLFKVEAEYVGCTDGKIHLHKSNGVKIAVPVVKMSREDLEYVERISGMSLDEDKPLSDIKQRAQLRQAGPASQGPRSPTKPDTPRKDDFDWFDFFLKCGVAVQLCERYSSNFTRDSMDEAILPEITPSVLRTLGLKEGDILRVMKFLDNKYGKSGGDRAKRNVSFGGAEVMRDLADLESGETAGSNAAGGLFSGPGGTLHNNTRKGRPAPAIQTTDIVDPKAFEVTTDATRKARSEAEGTANQSQSQKTGRFEDNAWDVKPSKISTAASPLSAQTARSQPPTALTGAMQELSLLSPPLQPSIAHSQSPHKQPAPAQQNQISSGPLPQQQQQQQQQQSQPMGANPSFFQQLGPPQQQQSQIGMQPSGMIPQQTLFNHQQSFLNAASSRQRPAPPPQQQQPQNPGGLLLPPPSRPLSAPQNISQQSVFGPPPPLQAQLTGVHFPGGSSVVTRIAPPGQSLYEMSQSHLQPQFGPPQQLQPQMTGVYIPGLNSQTMGMMGQQAGGNGIFPQPTGFQHMSTQQQMLNGQQTGSPFANASGMQAQGTSFGQPQIQLSMQPTGINSRLPPALQPQPTGQPSPLLFGHGQSSHFVRPPPPIPQGPISGLQPLVPQQTGPAPSIRFGVSAEKKLVPQPTGKRANLSQATPQNPFGF